MPQEIVMTLVNACTCTATGECLCTETPQSTLGGIIYKCDCDCECVECETEYVAEVCACGGNCACGNQEYSSPLHDYQTDNDSSYTWR